MEGETLVGLAGAGIVLALVAAVRQALTIPDRFTPLLSIALGLAWNVGLRAAEFTDASWGSAAILGVLSGLAASGLWHQGKTVLRDVGGSGGP